MTIMRKITGRAPAALLLGLTLSLGACGPDRSELPGLALGAARSLIAPANETVPDVRASLTPEVLAAESGPVLIVEVPAAPSAAGMTVAGTNRDVVTFSDAGSTFVIVRGGVIVGTRGFGFDLMNAEVSGTLNALASGGGRAERLHTYLDGLGKTLVRRFGCTLSPAAGESVRLLSGTVEAQVVAERCEGALGGVFENRYWIAGGIVVKSQQWVSPELGYILTERAK